ncbi:MAG TPA: type VI secretion system baseplate subunit TssG [Geminicoccaceae bacterium]|nr:type VI secretion system baseplate subunit TssG [Geminicoccaceae bacterium]
MAGQDRTAAPDLGAALAAEPWKFDFFQTLRLIECAHADRPRLGRAKRAQDDPVRLGQEPHLVFPAASLARFQKGEGGAPPHLAVLLLGLFGPMGPLPLHLTAYALERRRHHADPTLIDFADLFHHRILSLFYRAWAEARPHVQHDRPAADRFAFFTAALAGLGQPSLRDRDALPDLVKLRHTGLIGCQSNHPDRLVRLLGHVFKVPVLIQEFVGGWLELPAGLRTRLGERPETGTLGRSAVVGVRSFQRQHRFRIRLGPLGLAQYLSFLPGGERLAALVAAVRTLVDEALEWDLRLVLGREEVPALVLGGAARLGFTSWLPKPVRGSDPDDLVLRPSRAAS